MGNFLGNPPAAAAQGGGGRGALMQMPEDLNLAAVLVAFAAGVAAWSALTTRGYTPDLGAATVGAMGNLALGLGVHFFGRHRRALAFVNLCASFLPLMIAVARGELVRMIYDALAGEEEARSRAEST